MASVKIRITTDDIRASDIEITENCRLRSGAIPDMASVPDVLGAAVRRALAATAGPDGYRDAAWRLIEQLNVGAVTE